MSCKFSSEHRQESVKVQIISTNSEPDPSDVVEVSVYRSDNHLDQEVERLEVVCKVVRGHHSSVDVYWQVPGLVNHELHKDDLTVLLTHKFSIDEVELERVIVSTLVVEDLDEEDTGVYRCRVGQVSTLIIISQS